VTAVVQRMEAYETQQPRSMLELDLTTNTATAEYATGYTSTHALKKPCCSENVPLLTLAPSDSPRPELSGVTPLNVLPCRAATATQGGTAEHSTGLCCIVDLSTCRLSAVLHDLHSSRYTAPDHNHLPHTQRSHAGSHQPAMTTYLGGVTVTRPHVFPNPHIHQPCRKPKPQNH
jgi:hypothetical protein